MNGGLDPGAAFVYGRYPVGPPAEPPSEVAADDSRPEPPPAEIASPQSANSGPAIYFDPQVLEDHGFAALGNAYANWYPGDLQSNGKHAKRICLPNGTRAKSNVQSDRETFYAASAAVARDAQLPPTDRPRISGIVILHPSGVGCVVGDLDDCVTVDSDGTVTVDPWAQEIIAGIAAYSEISPSATGVRIVARGSLPPLGSGEKKIPIPNARPHAQMQFFTSAGYVTLTGHMLADCSYRVDVGEDRSDALQAVHARLLAAKSDNAMEVETSQTLNGVPRMTGKIALDELTAGELIIRDAGLEHENLRTLHVDGDWSVYKADAKTQSAADAALARHRSHYARGIDDVKQRHGTIERLMRQSAMYRKKWDAHPTFIRDTITFVERERLNNTKKNRTGPLNLVDLSAVRFERVRWFEAGLIPIAEFTIISGDGGLGKTSSALDELARASAGLAMPSGLQHGRPLRCLIIAEEDRHGLLRAKLQIAGANLNNIRLVDSVGANRDFITFPRHTEALREEVVSGKWDVVFVDSFLSHIDEKININKPTEVRRAIRPLIDVAHETGVTIIGIRHLTKNGGQAFGRGFGSAEFRNLCRSELLVAEHPNQDLHPGLVVITLGKSNLSADRQQSVGFRLRSVDLNDDDGNPTSVAAVDWETVSWISPGDLLDQLDGGDRSRVSAVVDWLRTYLVSGPQKAVDVCNAAVKDGYARATVYRARSTAGIISESGLWRLATPQANATASQQPGLALKKSRRSSQSRDFEVDLSQVEIPTWWT